FIFLKTQMPEALDKLVATLGLEEEEFEVPTPKLPGMPSTPGGKESGVGVPSPAPVEQPVEETEPEIGVTLSGALTVLPGIEYIYQTNLQPESMADKVTFTARLAHLGKALEGVHKSGSFRWTPDTASSGKAVSIVLQAESAKGQKVESTLKVHVGAVPSIQPLMSSEEVTPVNLGHANWLSLGDLNGDGRDELAVASGAILSGRLRVFTYGNDKVQKVSDRALAGRPVGLVCVSRETGPGDLFVGDWRNQQLIRYSLSQGGLVASQRLPLSGRPLLLASGNPDGVGGEGLAAFCVGNDISIFDRDAEGELGLLQRVQSPAGPFSAMYLSDFDGAGDGEAGAEVILVKKGKSRPNVLLASLRDLSHWDEFGVGRGVAQGTSLCRSQLVAGGRTGALLVANESGRTKLESLSPGEDGKVSLGQSQPVEEGVLLALSADVDGNGLEDGVFLGRRRIWLAIQTTPLHFAPLLALSMPPGAQAPLIADRGDLDGDGVEEVVFIDRSGAWYRLAIPTAGKGGGE
ncbi:MAG: FG-GAP repeat domain-containing protein, partial [Planctomycetota bacterium]